MKSPCDTCSLFPCVDDSNMQKVEKYCPWHNPKPKPITNADRIRSMTDEELAVWVAETSNCSDWCILIKQCKTKQDYECCVNIWLNWLRSEKEE